MGKWLDAWGLEQCGKFLRVCERGLGIGSAVRGAGAGDKVIARLWNGGPIRFLDRKKYGIRHLLKVRTRLFAARADVIQRNGTSDVSYRKSGRYLLGRSNIGERVRQADGGSTRARERRGIAKRILISHNATHDGAFALRLADALREIGAEPRLENLKAVCAEREFECLRLTLSSEYDHVIPLLSEAYLKDEFLVDELWAAAAVDQNTKPEFLLAAIIGDCKIPLQTGLPQPVTDFRSMRFQDAFEELTRPFSHAHQVFVIMTVGDPEMDAVYKAAVQPAIQQAGFSPNRKREWASAEEVSAQVLREIDRSALVFADLSGERPNCYLELGYALAKEKQLVLAMREHERLPFDLGDRQITRWRDPEELHRELLRSFSKLSETFSPQTTAIVAS